MISHTEEIAALSQAILFDLENNVPLHIVLLKAARLSLLLDIPKNVDLFKSWAESSEALAFRVGSFQSSMTAARDPDFSYEGENEYVHPPSNSFERSRVSREASDAARTLAHQRAATYEFSMRVSVRTRFGRTAENVFAKKRSRFESLIPAIFPRATEVLNSIDQNLQSDNPEHWKMAVTSCRSLLMDLADVLSPCAEGAEKQNYINRLKTFLSPMSSKTKGKLEKTLLDEMKCRIEHTTDLTQGSAHKDRPTKEEAEDIVLYTYLIVCELVEVFALRKRAEGRDVGEEAKSIELPSNNEKQFVPGEGIEPS